MNKNEKISTIIVRSLKQLFNNKTNNGANIQYNPPTQQNLLPIVEGIAHPVNINNLPFSHATNTTNGYYLPPTEIKLINECTSAINIVLCEFLLIVNKKATISVDESNVFCSMDQYKEASKVIYSPFTPTHKIAKYPYYVWLVFVNSMLLYTTVYFTKNASIGKLTININFNDRYYIISAALINDNICISNISITDEKGKLTIYNYKK